MSKPHRKPTASAKHRRSTASAKHRRPTASAKEVAKIAVTGAGSQRADHAGSGGRCAGARAGYPLSALPVEAQHIVRAGVLAFVLGVGAVVANTPAVAFAAPDDTSSSSSSSGSSSSTSGSSSESAASTSSTDPASSTTSSVSAADSSSGSTSEEVQRSVDSPTSSTSSPRHASTSTPSSSDTTASAEATPTEAEVPSAVATASPVEQPAVASLTEEPAVASLTEQPAVASPAEQPAVASLTEEPAVASLTEEPAVASLTEEPVLSLVAREGATPDAPQGESHTAPNSAGSALTNRTGSASSTLANQQSTVIDRAAATPELTAESLIATEAAVESVASIASAVAGAPEAQAVASALSDPSAPPNPVSEVVSKVLASVGLNPFASNNPVAPVDSPALWAVLAWVRRRAEEAQPPSSFGRMFPVGESSENAEVLEPLTQPTDEELAELAQGMLEGDAIDNPKGTAAGITFFGQFIDHDLTLDNEPQPTDTVDVEGLVNGRTFAFDLDSVYGGGPKKSPQLYDGDKFLIGTATDEVSPDLPRNKGTAILVEHRNDENLIIAQIHVSFLRLHNSLVDRGMSFDEARQTVVGAYRYVVLNDYLPQIVGQKAVNRALRRPVESGFYQPGSQGAPMTPVEFSTAAFRFGHSQVRNAYAINDTSGGVRVFSLDPAVPDLRGGRQLPAIEDPGNGLKSLVIDFDNFFSELPREVGDDPALIGRAIDTKIAPSLFELPIPGAEAPGEDGQQLQNVLAFRNLVRGKFYDLPSGEAIAGAMKVRVVGDPVFPEGTPLWYYVLREAEVSGCVTHKPCEPGQGGAELGPVGGRIVAEVFVDLLRLDGGTENVRTPNLPDVSGGDFRIGDLLVAADQYALP